MVLAALFGLLLAIDLVHLVIFFVRGIKARRQARRSQHAHVTGPTEGATLPPMQEHVAGDRGTAPLDTDITQSSDSDHTLAHSPNPQAVAVHDLAAGHTKAYEPGSSRFGTH